MEEELRDKKAQKDYYNMETVDEEDTYDYLLGKRYFICKDFENDGLHFRQPWVTTIHEEVDRLKERYHEQAKLLRECQALKDQVRMLQDEDSFLLGFNRVELRIPYLVFSVSTRETQSQIPKWQTPLAFQCSDESTVKERRKWSPKEDIILIGAWLNTSKDPIVGNEQKAGKFWKRIVEYYNCSPLLVGTIPRELGRCKQRWARINDLVCKFSGCYEMALREQRSGQNDNDVMKGRTVGDQKTNL
uniref:Myb-like domain-containing protein n=1 Tax=Brassica oleracea var. oleracea TaxID=109376 RepID=A0A0D3CJV8_BRAOL